MESQNVREISTPWNPIPISMAVFRAGTEIPGDLTFRDETAYVSSALISDDFKVLFEYVVGIWMCTVVSALGLVVNAITIAVFVKQGFQETVNISMTNLAVWDLLKCVASCMFRPYEPLRPSASHNAPTVTWYNIAGVSFTYLFFFTGCISSVVASYVAVERCLCVSVPFAVKHVLTPKVTTTINVVIPVIVFGSLSAIYSQYTIEWRFIPYFNTSVAKIVPSQLYDPQVINYYGVLSICWPVLSLVVICVCTAIISSYLRKAASVRAGMTPNDNGSDAKVSHLSSRDKRIIKMLFVILLVYIVTLFPRLVRYLIKLAIPEFKYNGFYTNTHLVVSYFMFLFDLINAAVNPFIFYFMSSQFRATVNGIFCFCWACATKGRG